MSEKYQPTEEELQAAEEQTAVNKDYLRLTNARQMDRAGFGIGGVVTRFESGGKTNVELTEAKIRKERESQESAVEQRNSASPEKK